MPIRPNFGSFDPATDQRIVGSFVDAVDVPWRFDQDDAIAERVQCATGFDLRACVQDPALATPLVTDDALAMNVILAALDGQRADRGWTEDQLVLALSGDAFERARQALLRQLGAEGERLTRDAANFRLSQMVGGD